MWADNAYMSKDSVERRCRALESYLRKLIGTETTEFLIVSWLDPKAKYAVSPKVRTRVERARSDLGSAENAIRASTRAAMMNVPVLARVIYKWEPQDAVELSLRPDEVIAVIKRETPSPGWWEGQTADGSRGLFPYNHVELLGEVEAAAVVTGVQSVVPSPVVSKNRPGSGSGKPKIPDASTKPKALRIVQNYALGSLESFDQLLDDGFTMEVEGKLAPQPSGATPENGDLVVVSYVAYLWDAQNQAIIEFAASDAKDRQGNIGPMSFTVGAGDVIKGLEYAVKEMAKGESARVTVKPDYAYGAVGLPPDVPPHSHLVYDITLEDFQVAGDVPPPPAAEFEDDDIQMFSGPTAYTMARNKPPQASYNDDGEDDDYVPQSSPPPIPDTPKPALIPQIPEPVPEPTMIPASPPQPEQEERKPRDLAEAIALRARKVAEQEKNMNNNPMRPVGPRAPRNVVNNTHNAGAIVNPGRARVEVDFNASNAAAAPAREPEPDMPVKKYPLDVLQRIVDDKEFDEYNIDPSRVEDYLNDEAFQQTFDCTRGEFLLKPAWRQQALKRSAGLY